jgi:hypothetical protein
MAFFFRSVPTYGTASLSQDDAWRAEELEDLVPVGWTNVPVARMMDTVRVQAARFRAGGGAGGDSLDVAFYADVPVRRLVRGVDLASGVVDMAFTTYDAGARILSRDSLRQIVRFARPDAVERRFWRRRRPAADSALVYRIEAFQPDAGRAARAIGSVTLGAARGFGVSDVVAADAVSPRDGAEPARWHELMVTPGIGVLRQGQSVGVMWETYELGARDGLNQYRVELELTVLEVERRDFFLARIVGGIADAVGLSAKGDAAVSLSYDRQRSASPVALDYLTLELGNAPAGRYRLTVRVTDRVTGRSTTTSRELTVTGG